MEDDNIQTVAKRLIARDLGDETVRLLKNLVAQSEISTLIPKLLANSENLSQKAEDSIYRVMNILQALAYFARPEACLLMSHLYSPADDLYMHDVCDSINIWIVKNHNEEMRHLLLSNPPPNMDDDMQHFHQEWVRG
jgi:hypothetical protein